MNIKLLEQLSIRSRLAFGASCLELLLKDYLQDLYVVKLLDKIWEFTESNKLDDWQIEVNEMTPYCILDPHPDAELGFSYLSLEEVKGFKILYGNLSTEWLNIIDKVVDIGMNNIYSGIVDKSRTTLVPLIEVVEYMGKNGHQLPNIKGFMKSGFVEGNEWGDPNRRSYYFNISSSSL